MDDGTSETFDSQTSANRSQKPLWKRKVFLTSGLYSDDHKVNDTVKVPTRKSFLSSQKERLQHGTERTRAAGIRRSAFPLPTDFGYWVLTEKRDYRLPFPIAEEIGEIREKMASKRKPPAYKHISQNKYYSRPKLPGEIMVCQCPPTGTCDENCMNRQTQYLCHPKLCPCGDRCTNIQFGKRKPIKTEVHWYGARGFGLRTLEPIAKDSFIDEYRGEVISYNEMVRRVRDHYKDTGNYYFLMYDAPAGEMLDGGLKGNITRYANHSCDPNCKIQKWIVCGTDEQCAAEFQVALYAGRDIAAGEELTYDYGWSAFSPKSVTGDGDINDGEACHCGAANCSGVMGRKGTSSTSSSNTNPSNTAAALRSGPARRKRKYKKRLALRKQKELAQAIGDQKQEKDDSGVTTESKSVALEQAAQEQSASTVKGRTYVRDRVSIGIRPMPTQLIDSDNVPILEGKRSRKSSTLSFADLEHTVAARPRKRGRHSNPLPSTNKSTAAHESASTMSTSASMIDITSSSSSFDMSNYPPGTKFYNRNGEGFDFSTLLLKRRGKKPKPYTRQELEEANERHRLNLKRLNDLRKFK
jgi:histone-lysine N-methyltransferase ASH1L